MRVVQCTNAAEALDRWLCLVSARALKIRSWWGLGSRTTISPFSRPQLAVAVAGGMHMSFFPVRHEDLQLVSLTCSLPRCLCKVKLPCPVGSFESLQLCHGRDKVRPGWPGRVQVGRGAAVLKRVRAFVELASWPCHPRATPPMSSFRRSRPKRRDHSSFLVNGRPSDAACLLFEKIPTSDKPALALMRARGLSRICSSAPCRSAHERRNTGACHTETRRW